MISFESVTKQYASLKAVDDFSLDIPDGDFFGLLGPNGAGKTTLIKLTTGLLFADNGHITIDTKTVRRNNTEVKRIIGIVPQMTNLETELTARENLEYYGMLYQMSSKDRKKQIPKMLEFCELADRANDKVKLFSGGMSRKLMIARALMHDPKFLLLDEPTVGLDVNSRRKIWDMCKKLNSDEKLTILLTTHYIEEAEYLCDHVGLINKGKLYALDTPEALITQLGKFCVEIYHEGQTTTDFFLTREEANDAAASLSYGEVRIRMTNLEDVFVRFTSNRIEEATK
jgi:ABC-2 type transport system ATP-binding protein